MNCIITSVIILHLPSINAQPQVLGAHHPRSIKFLKLSGLRGERGTGTVCGVWWHRKDTENASTVQSLSCCHLTVFSPVLREGHGRWRLMPNPCPSCSSTPELLLGLRPDRLPGSSPASPAAKWPFCRLREKNKNMKAGVIEANWGSKREAFFLSPSREW